MQLIRNIDLSFNEISDVGIEIFAKFIEKCPNIESLNLQGNSLGAPSAERLSAALATAESLKYLNLQYNKIGTAGAIVHLFLFRVLLRTSSFRATKSKGCLLNS